MVTIHFEKINNKDIIINDLNSQIKNFTIHNNNDLIILREKYLILEEKHLIMNDISHRNTVIRTIDSAILILTGLCIFVVVFFRC